MGYFSQPKTGQDKNHDRNNAAHGKNGLNGVKGEVKLSEGTANGKQSVDTVSTLGAGMLITGNIVCEGSARIFGRVIGDIEAVEVVVGDGARVEGNITAHEVGINGAFKGTIRGHNVRLKGAATIEGEVFSKSLTVEESVLFEGVSRRLEKPIELTGRGAASGASPPSVTPAESGSSSQT